MLPHDEHDCRPQRPFPVLTADGADLLALVELALAEARTLGASQAEAPSAWMWA